MERRTFRRAFVLLLVIGSVVLFLAVAWPMLQALFIAAVLAGLLMPVHRFSLRLCRNRKNLASGFTVLIVLVVLLGPMSAALGLVVTQAMKISEFAIPWIQSYFSDAGIQDTHTWLITNFPWVRGLLPSTESIVESIGGLAQSTGTLMVSWLSAFTTGTATLLFNVFVMFYAMFFFFRDGDYLLERVLYFVPLKEGEERLMLDRLSSVTRATIKGTLLIGLLQGTLAGLAFFAAGITAAAFWGAIMVFLSIIPGIGSVLVWGPAVGILYASGEPVKATLLLLWCACVVGTIDNLLRPRWVGQDARMPDLLIFIGTIGGLFLFGPVGFIIGPVACGLFLTILEIYAAAFRGVLPPAPHIQNEGSNHPPPDQKATPIAK